MTANDSYEKMSFERLADGRLRPIGAERYLENCRGGELPQAPKPQGVVLLPGPRLREGGGDPDRRRAPLAASRLDLGRLHPLPHGRQLPGQLDLNYVPLPSGAGGQTLYV